MANNIVTLDELDDLFADFIQSKLNLPADKVLISYSKRGQISSKYGENVCYIKFFNSPDEVSIYKNRRTSYDPETEQVTITQLAMRMLMLQVVFYGPDSESLAMLLNEIFYTESAKEFLHKNNMALIPDRTSFPNKTIENVNEQWWNRADLKLYFYNSISIDEVTGTIEKYDINVKIDRMEDN